MQSVRQTKEWQISWMKNRTPSLRSPEESIVNQNGFRVLSNLYITNFFETRKVNSNIIRVISLLFKFPEK